VEGEQQAKRSMRLQLVMIEKEDQERQRRAQEEEMQQRRAEMRQESIAQMAQAYIDRTLP
jgi:hypothetical protein